MDAVDLHASASFGELVVAILLLEVEGAPVSPLARGELGGPLDPLDEAAAAGAQRELGVDVERPREVDGGEEQVAELAEDARRRLGLRSGAPAAPISASSSSASSRTFASGPAASSQSNPAAAARRCTFRAWRSAGSASGTSWKIPSRSSCSRLISSQRPLTAPGVAKLAVAEDVGMATDELGVDAAGDLGEVARAPLLEEEREEHGLEEEVAQLVDQLGVVAGERGVGHLVRLLDRVRDDRPLRLRPVPGTLAPQPLGQFLELDERLLEPVAAAHEATRRSFRRGGVASPVVVSASGGGSKPGAYAIGRRSGPELLEPLVDSCVLLLLEQLRGDLLLDLGELLGRRLDDVVDGFDDVPAELGLHGLGELAGLELERDLVEGRHSRAFLRCELAAVVLRRGILRVLLRELGEVGAVLELTVDLVGLSLRLHEDVPHLARGRLSRTAPCSRRSSPGSPGR